MSFPHRLAFALLLSLLLVILLIQYLRRPIPLDASSFTQQPLTLPTRIDPNTATLPELARIPHLAETLAKKIIDYREKHLAAGSTTPAFHRPEDLMRIPRLQQKTLAQLLPYLDFPCDHDPPTTQP